MITGIGSVTSLVLCFYLQVHVIYHWGSVFSALFNSCFPFHYFLGIVASCLVNNTDCLSMRQAHTHSLQSHIGLPRNTCVRMFMYVNTVPIKSWFSFLPAYWHAQHSTTLIWSSVAQTTLSNIAPAMQTGGTALAGIGCVLFTAGVKAADFRKLKKIGACFSHSCRNDSQLNCSASSLPFYEP